MTDCLGVMMASVVVIGGNNSWHCLFCKAPFWPRKKMSAVMTEMGHNNGNVGHSHRNVGHNSNAGHNDRNVGHNNGNVGHEKLKCLPPRRGAPLRASAAPRAGAAAAPKLWRYFGDYIWVITFGSLHLVHHIWVITFGSSHLGHQFWALHLGHYTLELPLWAFRLNENYYSPPH